MESEAAARVLRKNSGRRERAPLALMILALYRQQKFTSDPSMGVGFTCHFNGASWASSRELGPYEYGIVPTVWIGPGSSVNCYNHCQTG